ncbi:MAG TPA: DUF1810 domain-containing protein [Anaerolineae bacterium]|nr:DUF1810 domain-containing protein [Anaerolineae bacterium]
MPPNDSHNLNRFIAAQETVYPTALAELKNGQKRTHWMWFIFPQAAGLGFSSTSQYYAIQSLEEARQYLTHPVLGVRLRECAEVLLTVEGRSVSQIFGYPDDLKLKSSMTLFARAADDPHSVFVRVLEKYFHGEQDSKTLDILVKFST